LTVLPENVPQILRERDQWIVWRAERKQPTNGKPPEKPWDKIPVDARTGANASTTNPRTWTDFATAFKTYSDMPKIYSGLGYVLAREDESGIDIDGCRNLVTGELTPEARSIVADLNSYVEASPSGTGIRIFAFGSPKPKGAKRKRKSYEIYDLNSPRYLTVTGHRLPGSPTTLEHRREAIDRYYRKYVLGDDGGNPAGAPPAGAPPADAPPVDAEEHAPPKATAEVEEVITLGCDAANGDKFRRLWKGDWESVRKGNGEPLYPTQSEADMGFARLLVFYTGDNWELFDRCFRASGLYRDKWDRLGEATFRKALAATTEFHEWPHRLDDAVEAIVGGYMPSGNGEAAATEPAVTPSGNGRTTAEFVAEIAAATAGREKPATTKLPKWTEGISAADLDRETVEIEFLADKLLTVMPTVIGGRLKSLKTLTMLDLAISLASGTKFLGRWQCRKVSVALWSGESGRAVLQNAIRRISAAKGMVPPEDLTLHFTLPKLHDEDDVKTLAELIRRDNRKAVFIDPAYLCLLDRDTAGRAGNVFVMGNVLRPLTEVITDTKCLVGLCHHFGKWTGSHIDYEPAELGELSQAGMAEWAGNWLLLARRAPYLDDGQHKLFLTAGNRCGQAYRLAVDVDEGPMDEKGMFRTQWRVQVSNVVAAEVADKVERMNGKTQSDKTKIAAALQLLGRKASAKEIAKASKVRQTGGEPGRSLDVLCDEGKARKITERNRQNKDTIYYEWTG
jgi:hypothetical protein